jgi:hypothetical protein
MDAMAAAPGKSTLFNALPAALHRADGEEGMMAAVARMAETAGVPPTRLMADFAALAVGPGRIDFADYERLRLYDAAFWGGHDRRTLIGARRGRELALAVNFRHDCLALATDRLAAGAYLSAHGLPTPPILAICRPGLAAPGPTLIRTRDELRTFLERHAGQPLVARPVEGGHERLLFADGADPAHDIERLLDEVRDAGEASWLLQSPLDPHPDAAADGHPTRPVRLLTASGEHGPLVLRAFWRRGGRDDLVACLDLETGAARLVFAVDAPHRAHPAPPGLAVPDWTVLKATTVEAARLMGQFGLLGWDVAATRDGPVILGLDPTPDLETHQLADRRGLMDPWFADFVAGRRRLAAEHRRLA